MEKQLVFKQAKGLLEYVKKQFQKDIEKINKARGDDMVSMELYNKFLDVKRDYAEKVFQKLKEEKIQKGEM